MLNILGRPKEEGGPKKTSPAQETSKKPISRVNLSRAGEIDAFTSQFQSAWLNGTRFLWKITWVKDTPFRVWGDNVTFDTLGSPMRLQNWVRGNVTRMSVVIKLVQKKSLPSGRDLHENWDQGRLTLSPDRERLGALSRRKKPAL